MSNNHKYAFKATHVEHEVIGELKVSKLLIQLGGKRVSLLNGP